MPVFDGRQLTAARALADLTIQELAHVAGVTKRTIQRLEASDEIHVAVRLRHGHVSADVWCKIVDALVEHGVELVLEDEDRGAGVRWTFPRVKRGSVRVS
jgi:predicted transcriptional regulator